MLPPAFGFVFRGWVTPIVVGTAISLTRRACAEATSLEPAEVLVVEEEAPLDDGDVLSFPLLPPLLEQAVVTSKPAAVRMTAMIRHPCRLLDSFNVTPVRCHY